LQYQEKISRNFSGRVLLIACIFSILFSCSGDHGEAAAEKDFSKESAAPLMDSAGRSMESFTASIENPSPVPVSGRKKILSGGCTIQTASPAEKIIEAGIIAQNFQGWIESSSDTSASVRVPVSNFKAAFSELLKLGIVIDKYEEAEDVTDFYSDLAARLEILGRTRLRLERLLNSEKDTEKKIPILREMKRIDDQIESIKAQLESLEKNISYSLIEITFIPFSYDFPEGGEGFFPWITSLDPFNATVTELNRKLIITLPDDFAVLKRPGIRYFHAQAADGSVLRIGSIKNKPEGSGDFWQKAVSFELGRKFAEASKGETGNLKYTVFKSRGMDEFHYFAGTLNRRKLLYIVEIYFPDTNSYEKRLEELLESLRRLEIK